MKNLLLVLLLFSFNAQAQAELKLSYLGIYHPNKGDTYKTKTGSHRKYNRSSVMVTYQLDNFVLSYFKNSHHDNTYFAGYTQNFNITNKLTIGYTGGLSYGYYLGKVLNEKHILRKNFYSHYERWDRPILPFLYFHTNYNFMRNHSIGVSVTANVAIAPYYNIAF